MTFSYSGFGSVVCRFNIRNLQMMRKFYVLFPNANTLCSELSWSHYRLLMRISDQAERQFYMEECSKSATVWPQRRSRVPTPIGIAANDRSMPAPSYFHRYAYPAYPCIPFAQLPTPLYKLENLSREIGKNIYIKRDDMTGVALGGNKVRKLEFLLADARHRRHHSCRYPPCGPPHRKCRSGSGCLRCMRG